MRDSACWKQFAFFDWYQRFAKIAIRDQEDFNGQFFSEGVLDRAADHEAPRSSEHFGIMRLRWILLLCLIVAARASVENEIDEESSMTTAAVSKTKEKPPDSPSPSEKKKKTKTKTKTTKKAIDKALAKKAQSPLLKKLQKHRTEILVTVSLVAFRREIARLLVGLWNLKSPLTGRPIRPTSPSSLLRMGVMIGFVWRLKQQQQEGDSSTGSIVQMLRAGKNPLLHLLASRLLWSPPYMPPIRQRFTFETLNLRYAKDGDALDLAMGRKPEFLLKPRTFSVTNDTIVVLDWTHLDSSVSSLDILRDQISFLVGTNHTFRVCVMLESPGGTASDYALCAQQLVRLKQAGISVTVLVDKVAASGGYMIACVADQLLVSPFAVIGSIGVVGQMLNVHRLLEGWGVQPLVFRGGRDKAPLSPIGEVSRAGLSKVQKSVDDVHRAFRRHVVEQRPLLADTIEKVANGDTWLGYDALDLGLVDGLTTSDEYLGERIAQGTRVLKLVQIAKRRYPFQHTTTVDSLTQHRSGGILSSIVSTITSAVQKHSARLGC